MAKLGSAPGAHLARFGAVLAIVLAILGMHGLSLHGAVKAATSVDSAAPHSILLDVSTPQELRTVGSGSGTAPSPPSPDRDAVTQDGGGSGGNSHSLRNMAMLCLATLVAALSLLTLMSSERSLPRVWAVLLPAINNRRYLVLPPMGTGPPYAWRFSVIRC